jgi:hypothetical protein
VDRTGSRPSLGLRKLLALSICVGFGMAFVLSNVVSWNLEDMDAYWNAAIRLREGQPLYPMVANPGGAEVFRYAPWFAWLWIPVTELPKTAVQIGWSAILLGSIPLSLWPTLRHRSVSSMCLAALMGGLLFKTASTGNVHALLVALLVHSVARRSGPFAIGIAASLKFAPIALALVYAGRRQWRRVAICAAVTLFLVAPAVLYDLTTYPADAGESLSLLSIAGPVPFAVFAFAASVGAVALARTRFAWAAASLAVVTLIPRLELYGLTYLLIGADAPTDRTSVASDSTPAPRDAAGGS